MSRSVVCGVDDTPDARRAVTVAARLAAALDLPLVLVHVAPAVGLAAYPLTDGSAVLSGPAPAVPYPPAPPDTADVERAREHGERLLAKVAADCGLERAGLRAETAADAAEGLRRAAVGENAEFLVVGSRGRGLAKSALLGSTSSELVAEAPCPVVVIPPEAGDRAAGSDRA